MLNITLFFVYSEKIKVMDENLKNHFLSLLSLALSDMDFDPRELELLYKIAEERGVTRKELNSNILNASGFAESSKADSSPKTLEEKVAVLYDLTRMAWADGIIEPEEIECIAKFCTRFGFREENAMAITNYLLEEVRKGTTEEELLKELKD